MFEGLTLENIFVVVIGVVIFVMGTTALRNQLRIKRAGNVREGVILRSKHIQKKDKDGYLIQNYYEVRVEFSEGGHKSQCTIRSVIEHQEGEKVLLVSEPLSKEKWKIHDVGNAPVFGPWVVILAGIIIASIPVVQLRYGQTAISVMLVAIMVLVGAAMVWRYVSDKRSDTTPIKATIVDVLKYQRGQKKKFSQPSIAYYPILKYEWKGQERTMRSHYNASTASAYKVGTEKTLYWDNARKCILERGPRIGILIGGIAFLAFSLLGIISTIVSL